MTRQREHIDRLLGQYAVALQGLGGGPSSAERHALHMIDEMLKMEDPVKLNRWFGFLQGVMWMLALRTIDELRDETRGDVHTDFVTWPAV